MELLTQDKFRRVAAVTQFHFISGMPRSEADALTAILAQNPRFVAQSDSPAADICAELLASCEASGSALHRLPAQARTALLRGAMDAIYTTRPLDAVVFDNDPGWMTQMEAMAEMMPLSRFVFVVRDPVQIIAQLAREQELPTVDHPNFARQLVDTTGQIGAPMAAIRAALAGPFAKRVMVIERTRLLSDPEGVMTRLYAFLREAPFAHRFDRLQALKPDPPLIKRGLRQILKARPMQGWRTSRGYAPVWRQMSRSPAAVLLAEAG